MNNPFLIILFRYLHIVGACLAFGGAFFMRVILPVGLSGLPEDQAREAFLRCRRVFKMVVHTCILFLLASGVYNSIRLWPGYDHLHGLWGGHVLLGAAVIGIALWATAGKTPPSGHRGAMLVNVVLLFAVVFFGAWVKYARETAAAKKAASVTIPTLTTP